MNYKEMLPKVQFSSKILSFYFTCPDSSHYISQKSETNQISAAKKEWNLSIFNEQRRTNSMRAMIFYNAMPFLLRARWQRSVWKNVWIVGNPKGQA